jgi:hypothetical protein
MWILPEPLIQSNQLKRTRRNACMPSRWAGPPLMILTAQAMGGSFLISSMFVRFFEKSRANKILDMKSAGHALEGAPGQSHHRRRYSHVNHFVVPTNWTRIDNAALGCSQLIESCNVVEDDREFNSGFSRACWKSSGGSRQLLFDPAVPQTYRLARQINPSGDESQPFPIDFLGTVSRKYQAKRHCATRMRLRE